MTIPQRIGAAALATALISISPVVSAQAPGDRVTAPATPRPTAAVPTVFEERRSGNDGSPTFDARGPGYTLTLEPAGATLALKHPSGTPIGTLRMSLPGAGDRAGMSGIDPLPGKVFHATAGARGTLQGNATYRRVKYDDVYPGIDLVYYNQERQLEFDFVVAPNADPKRVRVDFSGADRMRLDASGELVLGVSGEEVRLRKPLLYQEQRDGTRTTVPGQYRVIDAKNQVVGFEVGRYDRSRALVIDPVIVFATYRGGSGSGVRGLDVNALGEVYLFADADDPGTLPRNHLYQSIPLAPPQPGFDQCFLTKFARDGQTALYTVIFEGAGCQAMDVAPAPISDATRIHLQVGTSFHYQRTITESSGGGLTIAPLQGAYDVCVNDLGNCGPVSWMRADESGNVYFVMEYSPPGMTAPNFVHELRKIDSNGQLAGSQVLFQPAIFSIPGQGNHIFDRVLGFDLDASGSVYAAGVVYSPGLITPTADAMQAIKPSGNVCADPFVDPCSDGFILKVDTSTAGAFAITYASYLGGSRADAVNAVAVDRASGHLYAAGETNSFNFPSLSQTGGFLARLDLAAPPAQQIVQVASEQGSPVALTVLPGSLAAVLGIATDCAQPYCLQPVNPIYPARRDGSQRPFVSVHSDTGASVAFSTFLDTTAGTFTFPDAIATNGSGTLYVGMTTEDPALGTAGAFEPALTGVYDALVQAIDVTTVIPANYPPVITLTPSIVNTTVMSPTTGAYVPLVCGRLFTCAIEDWDEDLITSVAWFGPGGLIASYTGSPVPANTPALFPYAFVSLPPGSHVLTLVARDVRGGIGTAELTINVAGENTPIGNPVRVELIDPKFIADEYVTLGSRQPIDVTFNNVTTTGLTWLESRHDLTPPPGQQAGSPPFSYEISSTAAFDSGISVCFETHGMSFARILAEVQIYQFVGSSWVPLANQSQPGAEQVCGSTDTLGKFALFYPQVPSTAITAWAGTGCAENVIDGPGGEPCDDFQPVSPATASSLSRPHSMAVSTVGPAAVFVADNGSVNGSRIRKIDVASGIISTAVPEGVCYGFGPLAIDPTNGNLLCTQWDTNSGARSIIRYDLAAHTATPILTSFFGDIRSIVVDAAGNVFFADGLVRRLASGSTTPEVFVTVNDFTPGVHRLPYHDQFTTLAFDGSELLAGGSTLIRIEPGADGLVDGSPDEILMQVAGIRAADAVGYAEPFGGDGGPARQARLNFAYQMSVAGDGSVVFTDQSGRIRRIAGAINNRVDGDSDEIVKTIAGYFASTLPTPSDFATSEYGNFRGVIEDPLSPGLFIVASQDRHLLQRFGFNDGNSPPYPFADLAIVQSVPTVPNPHVPVGEPVEFVMILHNHGPEVATDIAFRIDNIPDMEAVIGSPCARMSPTSLACFIGDLPPQDSPVAFSIFLRPLRAGTMAPTFSIWSNELDPLPGNNTLTVPITVEQGAVTIDISETINVSDVVSALPAAQISIAEVIAVSDEVVVLPAAQISIAEAITVADAVSILPPVQISVAENITVTDAVAAVPPVVINIAEAVTVTDIVVHTVADRTPPSLSLPGNISAAATSAAGVVVNYAASAFDDVSGVITPSCTVPSGATFAIGTTTVTCTATDAAGNTATGSFTVTVLVGTPAIAVTMLNHGADASGYWVDLGLANLGTGHARDVAISALRFDTLTGRGNVRLDRSRTSRPIELGPVDLGGASTVRVYLDVPARVMSFTITERVRWRDVIGNRFRSTAVQTVSR